MKRNLFIICFLYSICSYSQVNDSFSDNNFTENPAWSGNRDKFIVSSNYGLKHDVYGLQLNDDGGGESYLSTPSTLVRGTTWQFNVFFYGFSANSKSYLKFYLSSSESQLTGSLSGYYLLFGSKDKNMSLVRQNGAQSQTIIKGSKISVDNAQAVINVKVTCSDSGKWTLMARPEGEEWQEEGSVVDKTFSKSNFAGLVCKYSYSSSKGLYIDDVLIAKTNDESDKPDKPNKPDVPEKPNPDKPNPDKPEKPVDPEKPDNPKAGDNEPPHILAVKMTDRSTIIVDFNERIVLDKAHFFVDNNGDEFPLKSMQYGANNKQVVIVLVNPLQDSKKYELTCVGVVDMNGNRIEMTSELFNTPNHPLDPDEPSKPDKPKPDDPTKPDKPKPDPDDNDSPQFISLEVLDSKTILLDFNETITLKNATFTLVLNGSTVDVDGVVNKQNKQQVFLSLSPGLENAKEYTLTCFGIEDSSKNRMDSFSQKVIYHKEAIENIPFGSIVFSEIMANPNDVKGLPESEYIELYNRTSQDLSLKRAVLNYGAKKYTLPTILIPAQTYIAICSTKKSDLWDVVSIPVTKVEAFPSLLNTGKLMWLEDSQGNLISWVDYSDSWYKDSKKKNGGFSLECVDVNNLSGEENNWKAAIDERGGTPSQKNSVAALLPDEKEINVLSCFMQTSDTIVVNFSKPMNILTLSNEENYRVLTPNVSIKSVIVDYPCGRNVKLALVDNQEVDGVLKLELNGLEDVSGNKQKGVITVEASVPNIVDGGDIQFNEVLFNPRSGESCYIELTNQSDKKIFLNQLSLGVGKDDSAPLDLISLSNIPKEFLPHTRLFFSANIQSVAKYYKSDPAYGIEINKFPKLNTQSGMLVLYADKGKVIDKMVYSDSMHSITTSDNKGVSLEKKSEELSSLEPANWLSASFLSNYGTPGLQNRCLEQSSADEKVEFWLQNNSFSPLDAQKNRLQLAYSFPETGYVATIKIYEASGREVCVLTNNEQLSAQGVMEWEGKEENSHYCRAGIYIAYIEVHRSNGKLQIYKLPFVIC